MRHGFSHLFEPTHRGETGFEDVDSLDGWSRRSPGARRLSTIGRGPPCKPFAATSKSIPPADNDVCYACYGNVVRSTATGLLRKSNGNSGAEEVVGGGVVKSLTGSNVELLRCC